MNIEFKSNIFSNIAPELQHLNFSYLKSSIDFKDFKFLTSEVADSSRQVLIAQLVLITDSLIVVSNYRMDFSKSYFDVSYYRLYRTYLAFAQKFYNVYVLSHF